MNILYYALDDALKKDILLDPGQLQSRRGKYRREFLLAMYFLDIGEATLRCRGLAPP